MKEKRRKMRRRVKGEEKKICEIWRFCKKKRRKVKYIEKKRDKIIIME